MAWTSLFQRCITTYLQFLAISITFDILRLILCTSFHVSLSPAGSLLVDYLTFLYPAVMFYK
uniref:Uncharacterized protein n=1 Tax=Octopus bimaculoides TaxID=37653 RepID=A0A0L8HP12_OCTBM